MITRVIVAGLILQLAIAVPACAKGTNDKIPNQQSIDELAARASQAQPRDQCFLYAELVYQMTEFSLRQYAAGNFETAADLLKRAQELAGKIHLAAGIDDKRLKNAEILLSHSAFRLNEYLHSSSIEDRPLIEQTLAEVNRAQTDAMMKVFKK
jgi:hypothetical protein